MSKEGEKKPYLKKVATRRKSLKNQKENSLEKKKHRAVTTKERESEEEREKKGSLKTRHKKMKISGKPKRHTGGALTPPVRTCHVAMMCTACHYALNAGWNPKSHV